MIMLEGQGFFEDTETKNELKVLAGQTDAGRAAGAGIVQEG
jgi:hypothetical protein